MNDEKFQELYNLVFSPMITPYHLLENSKLDNYKYVNYSKSENGLVVSMECELDKGFNAIFLYYFDEKDHLQIATMETNEGKEVIFDREKEIEKVKKNLLEDRKELLSTVAI